MIKGLASVVTIARGNTRNSPTACMCVSPKRRSLYVTPFSFDLPLGGHRNLAGSKGRRQF